MKKILFIPVTLFLLSAAAQPPEYPAAQPVSSLKLIEYFFDTDPGHGKGRIITLPSVTDAPGFQFQADLTGLAAGFHRIYLRSFNSDDKASHSNWIFFDNYITPVYPSGSPVADITAIEYFIDTDPGFGKGTPVFFSPAPDHAAKSVAINVTGIGPGIHRVYIRSKDSNEKWSLLNFGQFDNTAPNPYPSAPPPAPPIGQMEYYFDTDPGFGNGKPIQFTAGTDISNFSVDIPLGSLSQGSHTFYIRSSQNPWSFTAYVPFLFSSTLPVTWLYVQGEIKGDKTYIDWATATEEGTDKFLVEHSTDGRDFTTIGQVAAAGNSSSTNKYRFIHNNPEKGMNYYRLKQLDQTGKFTYSKALHLLYQPDRKEVMIAPNPVTDNLYIIGGAGNKLVRMELYDASGKLILFRQLNEGQQVYSIDIAGLPKGMYVVKVFDEKKQTSHRVLKQ